MLDKLEKLSTRFALLLDLILCTQHEISSRTIRQTKVQKTFFKPPQSNEKIPTRCYLYYVLCLMSVSLIDRKKSSYSEEWLSVYFSNLYFYVFDICCDWRCSIWLQWHGQCCGLSRSSRFP